MAFPEILTRSRFYLELKLDKSDDRVDGVFMDCSGFQVTQEAIEIAEVTPQKWGKDGKSLGRVVKTKIPGNVSYGNVTLKRGLTISMVMWNWLAEVQRGDWAKQRRDGSLSIYNQAGEIKFRFEFKRAWPSAYKIADVETTGTDYEIEEVEIVVEELVRVEPK